MSDMHNIEMNKETFWNLIAQAKEKCGQDLAASADWIKEQLLFMGAQQALDFHNLFHAYRDHAEQYGLWTAANLLCGGLSDDGFSDFRAWLVAQGRDVYLAALADPDNLADTEMYGGCSFEALHYVADRAYEGLTGHSAYDRFDRLAYEELLSQIEAEAPLGEGINYPYSREEAADYLPKLCAKYDVSGTGTWNYDSPAIKHALKSEKKNSRVRKRGDAR